jgi:hypothetical protein
MQAITPDEPVALPDLEDSDPWPTPIEVMLNWFEALRERVPARRH